MICLLFSDYNMAGHTYRFFKGQPLYPFGYGLSYTSFAYDSLSHIVIGRAGDTVHIWVNITNTGRVAGDEVAQVYLSRCKDASVPVPIRSLAAFRRIHLQPGERRRIEFVLAPNAFSVVNDRMQRVVLPGAFRRFLCRRRATWNKNIDRSGNPDRPFQPVVIRRNA